MKKFDYFIDKFFKSLIVVLFFILIVTIMWQITSRLLYIRNTWSEELCRWLFVWINFIGIAYFVKKEEHIRVDIFRKIKVVKKIMEWLNIPMRILALIFYIIMTIAGGCLVLRFGRAISPGLRIPTVNLYWSIPISFFLMSIFEIYNLFIATRRK